MQNTTSTERQESLAKLRTLAPRGSRVFTILRHVSRSGLRREISVVVWVDGERYPIQPNYQVGKLLGLRHGKSGGLILDGAGMDMGFDLVSRLAFALYGNEQALDQVWL